MRWMRTLLAGLAVFVSASVAPAQDQSGPVGYYAERYEGDRAVRVQARSVRDVQTVLALSRAILSERVGHGGAPIDVVVDEEAYRTLVEMGIVTEVLIEDVQGAIDAERAEIERRNTMRDLTWYENYHNLADIMAYVNQLATDHPALATTEVVGQSLQGRDIVALRVTGPGDPSSRVQVVFNGCQHAREWVSPPTVIYAAERLLTTYGTDQRVTDLMDRVEFVFLPIVNPDGYSYTWTNYRLWRKNRRNNGGGSFGVDLNRNWSKGWGGGGSSGNPSSDTYRGTSPFSEPETTAVSNFILGLPRVAAHIDFHSFSQLILYPWGWTNDLPPEPDYSTFVALGQDISDTIAAVHGQYYRPQRAIDLYLADGIMSDWSYDAGMWGLTIELRPGENSGYQFELPADQILPTGEENFPAILELTEFVAYPVRFRFPSGVPGYAEAGEATPISVDISASTGQIDPGTATLHARVGSGGAFTESSLSPAGGDTFTGSLPAAMCAETVEWYLSAETLDGQSATYPASGADAPLATLALETLGSIFDDAETDTGWTVGAIGDNATTGIWGRMDPQRTDAQPEDDHTLAGTDCWITDGRAGSSIGAYDVDNGTTTLTSPMLDATGGSGDSVSVLSYWRWYSNDRGGAANEDSMPVEVSFDGGGSWTLLEDVSENANAWVYREFVLNDFGVPSATTQVRFRARDLGSGSIVEAGVDDLEIRVFGCEYRPGDYNQDGVVDTRDVLDFLNDWVAMDPRADWNHDGSVNTLDVLAFLNDWNMG